MGRSLIDVQGFGAADFFVTGYWIWSKILENLASIGYDPTSAYTGEGTPQLDETKDTR